MPEEEKKGKGFVFVDKRKTHDDAGAEEGRADASATAGAPEAPKKAAKEASKAKAAETERTRGPGQPLPEVDFNALILSLSSSVMMHLGVLPNPVSHETVADLPLAKQTIDIIALLEQKTRGNLTKDEKQFVEAVLYDLRMKYVEVNREKE
jgi:hypothetical protein